MGAEQNDSGSDIATRFGCDGDLLQQTMQRVQSGELSPADATELLLSQGESPTAGAQTSDDQHETLASLIRRLGSPPIDIVDSWRQQMRAVAVAHFRQTGQPLPLIDQNEWTINASGQLLLHGRYWSDQVANDNEVDPMSADRIARFHESLAQPEVISFAEKSAAPLPSSQLKSRPATSKRKESPTRRFVIGGLILASTAAIGGILMHASRDQRKSSNASAGQQSEKLATDIFSASPIDQGVANAPTSSELNTDPMGSSEVVAAQLETFEGATPDNTLSITEPMALATGVEQTNVVPASPAANAVGSPDRTASLDSSDIPPKRSSESESSTKPTDLPTIGGPAIDLLAEDDGQAPEESPQVTRTSEVRAIRLPNPDDAETVLPLAAGAAKSVDLEFPFQLGLKLRSTDGGSEIVDARQDVAVALIQDNEDSATFSWTPHAGKTSIATSLAHGRLKLDGQPIYLRPAIEADPWPIDFERADVRPTWDLLAPLPPRVTRLSIDFALPDDVELGWIEQIDQTSPRRCRGLAVLTPKDGESISLGMRFDIRGGRKLACRVRYAARLGTESPWQSVSRPMLEKFADQLTAHAEVVSKQITQMSAIYSQADTDARRVLRPRRDALKQQSQALITTSEGVAELLSLIAKVEAGATLRLRVWVSWIDGEQTLLETKSIE